MPHLVERFEGFYRLQRWDVGVPSNVVRLIATQTQLGIRTESAPGPGANARRDLLDRKGIVAAYLSAEFRI